MGIYWKCFNYRNALEIILFQKCNTNDFTIEMQWKGFYNRNALGMSLSECYVNGFTIEMSCKLL